MSDARKASDLLGFETDKTPEPRLWCVTPPPHGGFGVPRTMASV